MCVCVCVCGGGGLQYREVLFLLRVCTDFRVNPYFFNIKKNKHISYLLACCSGIHSMFLGSVISCACNENCTPNAKDEKKIQISFHMLLNITMSD